MPINTSQSRQAPHSLVLGPFGGGISSVAGQNNRNNVSINTAMARFYAPPTPSGKGIVVRHVRAWCDAVLGTPGAVIDVLNGQTTLLNAALTFVGITHQKAVLANDGTEIVAAGNYLRVSGTESGSDKWDSTIQANVFVQVDYDLL